jgi:hypothetical protein
MKHLNQVFCVPCDGVRPTEGMMKMRRNQEETEIFVPLISDCELRCCRKFLNFPPRAGYVESFSSFVVIRAGGKQSREGRNRRNSNDGLIYLFSTIAAHTHG